MEQEGQVAGARRRREESGAQGLLLGLLLRVFLPESALGWWTLLSRLPGEVLLTALAAGPFLILFLRLDVDAEPDRRRVGLGLLDTRL